MLVPLLEHLFQTLAMPSREYMVSRYLHHALSTRIKKEESIEAEKASLKASKKHVQQSFYTDGLAALNKSLRLARKSTKDLQAVINTDGVSKVKFLLQELLNFFAGQEYLTAKMEITSITKEVRSLHTMIIPSNDLASFFTVVSELKAKPMVVPPEK